MLLQVPFESDYTAGVSENRRLEWRDPVNIPQDTQALGQLIDIIHQRGKLGGNVAFMGAMDIISHARTQFLIKSLQRGAIVALRRLFLRADPFSKSWNGIGPGIAIFNKLVNSSVEVRNCLLDFWPLILRPLKFVFQKLEKMRQKHTRFCNALGPRECKRNGRDERVETFQEQILPYMINDPRVILQREGAGWITMSDYMRNLELMFLVAPDRTQESVDRIYRLNRTINLHHTSFWEIIPRDLQAKHKVLPGPRLHFLNLLDRFELGRGDAHEAAQEDVALKAQWDLQAVWLDRVELLSSIEHETVNTEVAFKDSNSTKTEGKNERQSLSNRSFIAFSFNPEEHTPASETDFRDSLMTILLKIPDRAKHNISRDNKSEEECLKNAVAKRTADKSDTWAIAPPVARRLKQDPRQSKWFRKAVKPLINSLCLPESQKEAVKMVYAGYETIVKTKKHPNTLSTPTFPNKAHKPSSHCQI
ncbi:hypothetical protein ECG_06849 [Echinococcus granulosus]|uniref:Uncharacterized protein n=1 Tax=Echinococcus granulosus TaxID=6210 RepID=U6J9C7_ECHGR|nr:hypothetical protein EGR_02262 [Echinococcus granulosus]EUB62821.1 hypothetical protein EGR_02262 [Echinococcus granulosus]KAH9281090.1 hypothetical protein ECG_06849 [Echinococcus granulosus]CDS19057.1 hypothetical protein EgrG_000433800 [Echinococcus granulosus]